LDVNHILADLSLSPFLKKLGQKYTDHEFETAKESLRTLLSNLKSGNFTSFESEFSQVLKLMQVVGSISTSSDSQPSLDMYESFLTLSRKDGLIDGMEEQSIELDLQSYEKIHKIVMDMLRLYPLDFSELDNKAITEALVGIYSRRATLQLDNELISSSDATQSSYVSATFADNLFKKLMKNKFIKVLRNIH
jgi:hypothetical protein